jgi:hypothetical protein
VEPAPKRQESCGPSNEQAAASAAIASRSRQLVLDLDGAKGLGPVGTPLCFQDNTKVLATADRRRSDGEAASHLSDVVLGRGCRRSG